MGWVGMGWGFLVTFAANLPLGNTQQLYSPLGRGRMAVRLTPIPTDSADRRVIIGSLALKSDLQLVWVCA